MPCSRSPRPERSRRRRGRAGLIAAAAFLALLAGESALGAGTGWYTVREGDSLSRIAQRLGVKMADLARQGGGEADALRPGERLQVAGPLRLLRGRDIRWRRPFAGAAGRPLRPFGTRGGPSGGRIRHTGVDVPLPQGSEVRAPATGLVLYCGPQEGFGTVVILEHGDGWSSVLAPVAPDTARCRAGEIVLRGDLLGRTAAPEEGPQPCLHVELRRNREAVAPDRLLR